jgi:hypothetical protein
MTVPATPSARADTDELPEIAPVALTEPVEPVEPEPAEIELEEAGEPADGATDTEVTDGIEIVEGMAASSGLQHPAGLFIAAVLGGAMAYSFDNGSRLALVAVAVAQGLLIVSWVFGTGLSGRIGALVLGAGTATAADIVVTHWRSELGPLVGVLGLAMVAQFGHQLLRGRHRVQVVDSLSDISMLLVGTTAVAALIELRHQVDGPAMTVAVLLCATAALVAGHLIDWIWVPLRFDAEVSRGLLAVVASVVAGAVVTLFRLRHSVEFTGQRALLLGAGIALVAALFAVGAAFIAHTATLPSGRVARICRPLASTTLVFALTSPIAYLLCLALRG